MTYDPTPDEDHHDVTAGAEFDAADAEMWQWVRDVAEFYELRAQHAQDDYDDSDDDDYDDWWGE